MARRRAYRRDVLNKRDNFDVECIQIPSWSVVRTLSGSILGGAASQVHETITVNKAQLESFSRKFDDYYFFRPKKYMVRYRNKYDNDRHTAWFYTHRSGVIYDNPMNFINEATAASLNNVRRKLPNAKIIPKDRGMFKGFIKTNHQYNVEYEGGVGGVLDTPRRAPWVPCSLINPEQIKFYCKSLHLPGMQNLDWEGPEGGITDLDGLNEKPTNQLVQEVIFDLYVIVEFKMSRAKGLIHGPA